MKSYTILYTLLLLSIAHSWAQENQDYHVTPNQEFLNQIIPNEEYSEFGTPMMVVDKNNILWISGPSGIIKYDGFRFEYFKFPLFESTTDNVRIVTGYYDMTLENNEVIWMPSISGISRFDTKTELFKYYRFNGIKGLKSNDKIFLIEQLYNDRFISIVQLNDKREIGIIEYDDSLDSLQFFNISFSDSLGSSYFSIEKGKENRIYFGTTNGFIEYDTKNNPFEKSSYTKYNIECLTDSHYQVRAIEHIYSDIFALYIVDSDKNIHVLFYSVSTGKCNYLPISEYEVPSWELISFWDQLLLDETNNIWLSGFGNPILKYNIPDKFDWLNDSLGLDRISRFYSDPQNNHVHNNRFVRNLTKDGTGNVWISTNSGLWRHENHLSFIKKVVLPKVHRNKIISKVTFDSLRNRYWICTDDGLLIYDNQKHDFKLLDNRNTIGDLPIKCLDITLDNNTIWIASETGLYSIISTNSTNSHFKSNHHLFDDKNQLGNAITYPIQVDQQGYLYITFTILGIHYKFNPNTKEYLRIMQDSPMMEIYHENFFINKTGSTWARDDLGRSYSIKFTRQNDDTIFYRTTSEIPNFNMRDFIETDQGLFGLSRDGSLIEYKQESGQKRFIFDSQKYPKPLLPSELEIDNNHNFWFLTKNKLFHFHRESKQLVPIAEDIINVTQGGQTYLSSYKNQLLVPGKGHFFIINTDEVVYDSSNKARISKIEVNGKSNHTLIDTGENTYNIGELGHKENIVEIFFAPYDLGDPNALKFEYQLIGIDDEWTVTSSLNSVRFTQLHPGKYQFKLRSSTNGDQWSADPILLNFRILSPWYWNIWSKLLYLIIILSLLYIIYRFKIRRKLILQEKERLSELNNLKSRLYTNITHEFRTPLTVILGMANEIKQKAATEDEVDRFDKPANMIVRNGGELLRLVNQMLDLAKAESGNLDLNMVQADVVPFLSYITESFQSMAESNNVRLMFYPEVDELIMDFDSDKLLAIVSNLLSNAIKFTKRDGKVVLHASRKSISGKDELIIKIKDSGIGIAQVDLENVFDRFYQVDSSTTRAGEGTGIGLSLTKELVELLEGDIVVKSEIEKGSEFTIKLPINNTAPISSIDLSTQQLFNNIDTEEIPIVNDETSKKELPIVLIVEDNQDVATYIQQCLIGHYNTLHAKDGAAGIEEALSIIPDIIISDVMMPKKDGFELCETLKLDIRTSHIPIILLTAKATQQDRIQGLSRGADAYLAKPFNKAELYIRLKQLIELRQQLREKFSTRLVPLEVLKTSDDPDTRFIQKAIDAILLNLDNNEYNAPYLARDLSMSESSMYRKLKALTDKSTAVFIRSVRLQRAKELLESSNDNISEIAYEVGFKDPAWFSRIFKEEFGFSPSDIRK